MRNFDTCFFERYARICLTTVLGEKFAALVNADRPDLQMEDKSLGIEVTRAMEPRKEAATDMLKEMAGLQVREGRLGILRRFQGIRSLYILQGRSYIR